MSNYKKLSEKMRVSKVHKVRYQNLEKLKLTEKMLIIESEPVVTQEFIKELLKKNDIKKGIEFTSQVNYFGNIFHFEKYDPKIIRSTLNLQKCEKHESKTAMFIFDKQFIQSNPDFSTDVQFLHLMKNGYLYNTGAIYSFDPLNEKRIPEWELFRYICIFDTNETTLEKLFNCYNLEKEFSTLKRFLRCVNSVIKNNTDCLIIDRKKNRIKKYSLGPEFNDLNDWIFI